MHGDADRRGDPLQGARDCITLLIGLSQALSMPPRVWLTRFGTAGDLAFGNRIAVIGWLTIPLFPTCAMPCDPRPTYAFWGLTTFLLVCHRLQGWRLRRCGYWPHSMFMGLSRAAWPGRPRFLGLLEAALTTGIGFLLAGPWPSLGLYLAWSGIAMVVA